MARIDLAGFDSAPIMKVTDADVRREITKRVLEAGAGVMVGELKRTIENKHHVVSHDMAQAVAATKVYEDLSGGYIFVYPQGIDSRGVKNAMKHTIINKGGYAKGTKRWKKDPYQTQAEKAANAKVNEAMQTAMQRGLRELGLTD